MNKYQTIASTLSQLIDEGRYRDRLPTIRSLMAMFRASQSTINHALQLLVQANKIYNKPHSGYFIIPTHVEKMESHSVYDFSTASTSWTDFPMAHYVHCLEVAFKNEKEDLFTYGDVTGQTALKQSFQSLIADQHIFAKTDQIVITSGTQQALHLLALMMKTNHDKILIEQPTYHQMVNLIERLDLNYATYGRHLEAFDMDAFEKVVQRTQPDYVYLMPRLHNPIGTTISEADKVKLIQLAHRYHFYMIEDDYLGDFEHHNAYKSLYELDDQQHVIYLKSFSKIMFPGQRLGFAVLPENLVEPFVKMKEIADIQTNTLSQLMMQTFIQSGLYDAHKNNIISKHRQKVKILQDALKRYFHHYQYNDNNKLHTVIKLSKRINMTGLYRDFEKLGIWVDDYRKNYMTGFPDRDKFLKLNTTRIAEDKIDPGLRLIRQAIRHNQIF
ncbi:PLP-dependent aminotransferase family protein [Staphylococcus auricularis]|uniref:aminotransferase-like domain-containing protein n=1 Tax=Staphylococcus auricularis TaxID=29379 RepID=UPI00242C7C54|nr:PLP-dependent aminotransferase family protein [Staphylococcus auricularis]